MTTEEIHKEFGVLCDEAQIEWPSPAEIDVYLRHAAHEWYNAIKPEDTQENRDKLGNLLVVFEKTTGTDHVVIGNIVRYKRLLMIMAEMEYWCDGELVTKPAPVAPLNHDQWAESLRNHNLQPNDLFPAYIEHRNEGKRTLRILSDNPPKRVFGSFLRNITPFNVLESIQYNDELPEDSQREIIDRAVRIWAGIVGDQARYQQQVQVELPLNQVTKQ